jgi:hypothetical protein
MDEMRKMEMQIIDMKAQLGIKDGAPIIKKIKAKEVTND